MSTAGWIVLIIVIVAVVAVLALTVGRTQARRRQEGRADSLREEAAERARDIERREAEAAEMEAEAQRARAEAEQRMAQAAQMEAAAEQHRSSLEDERVEVDESLEKADRIDPRVGDSATTTSSEPTSAEPTAVEGGTVGEDAGDDEATGRGDPLDDDTTRTEPAPTHRTERG
jgi:ribonuclease E